MTFEERFLISLGWLVTSRTGERDVNVQSYQTTTFKSGRCETCSYDVTEVTVYYTVGDSSATYPRSWTYIGDLGSLMREMSA
jgi:hypothetical protein